MKMPGPREDNEEAEEMMLIELETAAPAIMDCWAVLVRESDYEFEMGVHREEEVAFPPWQEKLGRFEEQSGEHPSFGPESHFSFPTSLPSPHFGVQIEGL